MRIAVVGGALWHLDGEVHCCRVHVSMFAEEEEEDKPSDNYFRLLSVPNWRTRVQAAAAARQARAGGLANRWMARLTPLTVTLATATMSEQGCGPNSMMQLARPGGGRDVRDVANVRSAPHYVTQQRSAVVAEGPLTPSW